jgi:hypothetical protein
MGAKSKRWSQRVTEEINALDLEDGVFTQDDPKSIARSLKRSAELSHGRKSDSYHSSMSTLTFYSNRARRTLPKERRQKRELAKVELHMLFGKEAAPGRRGAGGKHRS